MSYNFDPPVTLLNIFKSFLSRTNSEYKTNRIIEVIYDAEFCAGVPDINGDGLTDGGSDACQGDSGGPLICNDGGRPVVYGVTSRGEGCAKAGYPGLYAKIASELDWIKQQL